MTQPNFDPDHDALRVSDLPDPKQLVHTLTCQEVQEMLRRREESGRPLTAADLSSVAAHITSCPDRQQQHEV